MTLAKQIAKRLSEYKDHYAVYGAYAANIFRKEPREVHELSFALALGSAKKSRKVAEQILEELGFTISYEWLEGLQSKTGKTVCVVIGTPPEGDDRVMVRFLVPSLPWVSKGVRRAYGVEYEIDGIKLPVVDVDDLIVAKIHYYQIHPTAKDAPFVLDDLSSIFQSDTEIDIPYIIGELNLLELNIANSLESVVPEELKKFIK